jgi:protein-tyrosine phosphatase
LDWITPEIAIGNCDDAIRLEGLRGDGIAGILSLTGWPNSAFNRYGIDWRCVELIDGEGNEIGRLHEAVWHLHELVTTTGRVLVHCMEGVSRSPLVVASYLADTAGRPFDECLGELARLRKHVLLQPGLWDLRRAFEQAIEPHERISGFAQRRTLPLAPAD